MPEGSLPPPVAKLPDDWSPFNSRVEFEFADLIYRRNQMPKTQINDILDIWVASMLYAHPELSEASAPFGDASGMLASIDNIRVGDAPWQSFVCSKRAAGSTKDSPEWMRQTFEVWFRDIDKMADLMIANPDFKGEFDFTPYREFNKLGELRFCDFFSGNWSWETGRMYQHILLSFIKLILYFGHLGQDLR